MKDLTEVLAKIEDAVKEYPSRICLVCDRSEYPKATIIDTAKAWLCPRCKERLKAVVNLPEEA